MRKIWGEIKGVMLHPASFLSKNTDGWWEVAKYLLILTLIPATIGGAVYSAYPDEAITSAYAELGITLTPSLLFFLVYADTLLGFLMAAGLLHIFAYVWGARYGFRATARAAAFAYTPLLLLGWVPLLYYPALVWAIILLFIGLREQQKIPATHVVGALVTPIVSLLLLAEISALAG